MKPHSLFTKHRPAILKLLVCLYRATLVAFNLYWQTTVHTSMYKVTTSLVLKVEKIMNKCPLIKNNV